MAEFTGERLIPGQVDVDLLNEHLARYAFAARLAHGKRVLDAGCGAGYGSAELASQADSVAGADLAAEAVDFACAHYRLPNLALVGKDPLAIIQVHFHNMFYAYPQRRREMKVAGGIDMALWDLAGKILNRPVSKLLGGNFRDEVLLYSHAPAATT